MIEKPFQGLATFLKTPVREYRPITFIGVPFDGATSYRPGARFGPNAVRKASMMLTDGEHPRHEIDPALITSDFGDIVCSNTSVERSLDQITDVIMADPLLRNTAPLFCGGDHTITLAVLRAFAMRYEDPVVLHFDAHCDTWSSHFEDQIGHGTWVRNVVDENLIPAENIMQIGLRSPVDRETKRWLPERGGHVIDAIDAQVLGAHMVAERIKRFVADRPVYISFDIDVLDPAFAPGTGTPEVGGLSTSYMLLLLNEISCVNIVGMDLVEVNPAYDHSEITALAGATLLWTVASMIGVRHVEIW